ncbi:short-chain dehydrogenase/reductase SDR [Heterostelium album PN500]|uniref:Short-chain dehydrogenase/reductase SDR n=1 Tax=Heterostelium pallidum (strain ATCC 26659 / Pp 5 / PN500) TaxID=670386 RepID=D3B9V1_HETP5|nr:short-chain dehydrogenase/reductase SDR [Heterostelium album PN500]EFA82013.1 short-chain dehydrogenase/reductase SDR [Heterostelium album PN500]|eukprot:XP_020434130.1 short-chain dehydrogenase/reductase SDR [Heterostelium album PN500]
MTSTVNIKSTDKVWYITGSSKGMGLIFVQRLLAYGFKVVGTSRDKQQLIDAVGSVGNANNFLAIKVELTNEESIKASFEEALSKFGRIDVVVNNAGFGLPGAVEENSDEEVRKTFDINVFAVFNVLRNVTPILRNQGYGHVFNISSTISLVGFEGFALYCATKFAIDGLTEAYAMEVKPFGIKAMTINPAYFKTDFLTADSFQTSAKKIPAYEGLHKVEEAMRTHMNGTQRGDPVKLLDVILRAFQETDDSTDHLFVGADAYPMIRTKLDKYKKDLDKWEQFATKTDRDDFVDPSSIVVQTSN